MVLLQPEAPGLEGWHLCSLHGQQGIVPANRVKVLPEPGSPGPTPRRNATPAEVYQVPRKEAALVGTVPRDDQRRRGQRAEEQEVYEVPPPARPCPLPPEGIYRVPRGIRRDGGPAEVYDVPSSLLRDPPPDIYDSPAPCPKKVARVAPQPTVPPPSDDPYDVPLAFKKPQGQEEEEEVEEEDGGSERPLVYATPSNLRRASALLNLYESPEEVLGGGREEEEEEEDGGIYDVPLLAPSSLPLEGALQGLNVREPGPPSRPRLPSAESLSRRPLPALPSEERLSAEPPPPSPSIVRKGSIQDRPLPPPPPRLGGLGAADQPEQFPDDGHNEYEGIRLAEEYDYVHLKGADKIQPKATTPEGTPGLAPTGDTAQTEEVVSMAFIVADIFGLEFVLKADIGISTWCRLPPRTASCCSSTQGSARLTTPPCSRPSRRSLPALLPTSPPRVFVPHGKFVIITAHKLVFVGDTVSRLASSATVRARVGAASSALCQALKDAVLSVKGAALRYPSPPAAREMRECVAELSRRALAFTSLLGTLAPS
ncbi:hypothetical protein lerEdw1_010139 [Lerista edwardsae]|nr:hypothetical protein lerEdw1_010139 [Lerista edwardsae]